MRERLAILQALVETQRQAFNAAMVGRVSTFCSRNPGRHDGQIAGKSPYMQPVHVFGPPELVGRVLRRKSMPPPAPIRSAARSCKIKEQVMPEVVRFTPRSRRTQKPRQRKSLPTEILWPSTITACSQVSGQYDHAQPRRRSRDELRRRGVAAAIMSAKGPTSYCALRRGRAAGALRPACRSASRSGSATLTGRSRHTVLAKRAPMPTSAGVPSWPARHPKAVAQCARAIPAQTLYCARCKRHELVFAAGPAGTGKTWLPSHAGRCWSTASWTADPVAPGGRGGRAAGLSAGRHARKGRSLFAPALRRAVRCPGAAQVERVHGDRDHRSGARSPSCAGAR